MSLQAHKRPARGIAIMDYQGLKEEIDALPELKKKDHRSLFSLASIAGDVWPKFQSHLDGATCADEFFEAIYNDDEMRFENVWAEWAKMKRKKWVSRFDADKAYENIRFEERGIFLTGNAGNELLIPMIGRGKFGGIYIFEDSGFNERAAELYGSINGEFSCMGIELKGAFDIYRTDKALIFERWDVDKLMRRKDGKGQASSGCACNQIWDVEGIDWSAVEQA